MNLLDIRTSLRKRIGNPDANSVPDADLNEVINEAYQEICDEYRFRATRELATFSTVVGANAYGLPSNCLRVKKVKDCTNDNRILKRTHEWALENTSDTDTPGKPLNYALYENYIKLFPTPNGIYTISLHYQLLITDLASDSDIPIIPDPWHRGLILFSRYKYYDYKGLIPMAQYTYRGWQAWLSGKPNELEEEEFEEGIMTGSAVPNLASIAGRVLDFDHSD